MKCELRLKCEANQKHLLEDEFLRLGVVPPVAGGGRVSLGVWMVVRGDC